MTNLCAPAIIYLIFSITQILIDTFNGLYNTAFIKIGVTIMITILLNILCNRGLGVISWIIVFIPFILMTVIVSLLLYIFGLDAATGKINLKSNNLNNSINDVTIDALGNIVIYDPEYNSTSRQVYYQSPNIIVPNPHNNDNTVSTNKTIIIPMGSSSPAYQS
jgi:hypothetical protein